MTKMHKVEHGLPIIKTLRCSCGKKNFESLPDAMKHARLANLEAKRGTKK